MRAHLALAHARLALAEGRGDEVEPNLQTAIDGFTELGYPYDLAVAQTELASWLAAQDRAEEAGALVAQAIDTFTALRALPDLDRAQTLLPAATPTASLKV
jgi:hypothetical protein